MEYKSIKPFKFNNKYITTQTSSDFAKRNHLWYIQEKIDGSNFRFNVDTSGNVMFSCKYDKIDPTNVIFTNACRMIELLKNKLSNNYIYYGEVVSKCKNNTCEYLRIPRHYFVCCDIYDIQTQQYLKPDELKLECFRIGFECVKFIYFNFDNNANLAQIMKKIINRIDSGEIESMLGGIPEGIVLKHECFWYKNKYIQLRFKLMKTNRNAYQIN